MFKTSVVVERAGRRGRGGNERGTMSARITASGTRRPRPPAAELRLLAHAARLPSLHELDRGDDRDARSAARRRRRRGSGSRRR
jgi:hypothetical protein